MLCINDHKTIRSPRDDDGLCASRFCATIGEDAKNGLGRAAVLTRYVKSRGVENLHSALAQYPHNPGEPLQLQHPTCSLSSMEQIYPPNTSKRAGSEAPGLKPEAGMGSVRVLVPTNPSTRFPIGSLDLDLHLQCV